MGDILSQTLSHSSGCPCSGCSNSTTSWEGVSDSTDSSTLSDELYTPTITATNDDFASYLTNGFFQDFYGVGQDFGGWEQTSFTYSISSYYSSAEQDSIRNSLQQWSDVTNITFTEVSSGADIAITNSYSGSAATSISWSYSNGAYRITSATVAIDYGSGYFGSDLTDIGNYALTTMIHELGHALGLGHTGNYNAGQAGISYDNSAQWVNDTRQYSIMSYWDASNSGADHQYEYPSTPMLMDIYAIQQLYGANMSTRSGDTIYGFNTNTGIDQFDFTMNTNPVIAIWDGGGTDTLDVSGWSDTQMINLGDGTFSNVSGGTGNLAIAYNAIIENAIGGTGIDTIYGNDVSNVINGNDGDDILYGSAGDDTLDGDGGSDTVIYSTDISNFLMSIVSSTTYLIVDTIGSYATDTLIDIETFIFNGVSYTKTAFDSYIQTNNTYETIIARFNWGTGNYRYDISGSSVDTTLSAEDISYSATSGNLFDIDRNFNTTIINVLSESASDGLRLDGTSVADTISLTGTDSGLGALIYLGDGDDALTIASTIGGNSTIFGQADNDTIQTGSGNDRIFGGTGDDIIYGGAGDDDRLVGEEGDDIIYGEGDDDYLYGDDITRNSYSGADTLYGGDGNDYLYGGLGNDTLYGESGNDTIYGDDGDDIIDGGNGTNIIRGGDGNDIITGGSGKDKILGDGGNDTIDGGATADYIEGGTGDDIINGGDGHDTLSGEDDNDTINGDAGNDYIYGGNGIDILSGGTGGDRIFGGAGNDTINGNEDNDSRLVGEEGDDTIYGGDGHDFIWGDDLERNAYAGADTLYGGDGNDTLYGGDGDDTIYGDNDDDILDGDAGADTLNGGAGLDTLRGGTGNDTLNGDSENDTLLGQDGNDIMNGGTGHDILYGGNDTDTMHGDDGNDTLFGEEGNDTLYGDDGVDTLYGNDGDDIIYGGTGDDNIYGSTGDDTLYGGDDNDTIRAGLDNDTVYGGNGSDFIKGEAGNDILYGEAGDDILRGEEGDDTLYGGTGSNKLIGGADADTFVFEAASAFDGVDVIADFSTGENDVINISDVLSGYDSQSDDIHDFVSIISYGNGNASLSIDIDGTATGSSLQSIATIANGAGLDIDTLISNGNLIV